jgi:hypothetical protein
MSEGIIPKQNIDIKMQMMLRKNTVKLPSFFTKGGTPRAEKIQNNKLPWKSNYP